MAREILQKLTKNKIILDKALTIIRLNCYLSRSGLNTLPLQNLICEGFFSRLLDTVITVICYTIKLSEGNNPV